MSARNVLNKIREFYLAATCGGIELLEVRPGHYVKVCGGQVAGKATSKEIAIHKRMDKIIENAGRVDFGTIEVSLALAALSALLTTQDNVLVVRILALLSFTISASAAGILYWTTLYETIPKTARMVVILGGIGNLKAVAWLSLRWAYLLKCHFFGKSIGLSDSTELGYLNSLAAFQIVWTAIYVWIGHSFYRSFVPQ